MDCIVHSLLWAAIILGSAEVSSASGLGDNASWTVILKLRHLDRVRAMNAAALSPKPPPRAGVLGRGPLLWGVLGFVSTTINLALAYSKAFENRSVMSCVKSGSWYAV